MKSTFLRFLPAALLVLGLAVSGCGSNEATVTTEGLPTDELAAYEELVAKEEAEAAEAMTGTE